MYSKETEDCSIRKCKYVEIYAYTLRKQFIVVNVGIYVSVLCVVIQKSTALLVGGSGIDPQ